MTTETIIDPSYPIGKYVPQEFSKELKEQRLADIRFLPDAIEHAIQNLDEQQLQTPYREGGWTVHQLIHHIADSHMNAISASSWATQKTIRQSNLTRKSCGPKRQT